MDDLGLRPQSISRDKINSYSHLSDLIDFVTYENATPSVLIGAEHWHLSINREVRTGGKNDPVACLTALGWTLYGVASSRTKLIEFVNHTFVRYDDDSIETLLKEQYKLDSIGIKYTDTSLNKQDQRAVVILEATARRLPSGRFEVGMPWRDDVIRVPDSHPQALSRFLSLERRMSKEPEFAKAYTEFMNNMIDKGYAEECSPESYHVFHKKDCDNLRLYLPHFGVYHPQKQKVRVVHDAAARNEGISLNSLLIPGPDLLQPLLKILFRFREGLVAMTADIKEMFPQVRIREQDRDALRYLWRSDKSQPLKEFRMTSVIFGACCSPFVAQFIKNKNAREHAHQFPKAVDAILFSHYMDDYIDSQDDVNEAAHLAADIVKVHGAACFEMRGWISNKSEALKLVPEDLRAVQQVEVDLGEPASFIRALGIAWYPSTDFIGFRTGLTETAPVKLTKRKVLSHIMRVYDPLGLLGPIVVQGRILFQQTWRTNVGWDTDLPQTEASKWSDWFRDLSKVTALKIPRWYSGAKGSEPSFRELHVFSDASELAYACVAYWRLLYPDGSIKVALIASKARVSPLRPISIPRLELQAALIASRLGVTIKDSHRKKSIHLNVADDATRLRPINLDATHRWFSGPSFLLKSSEDWPSEPLNVPPVRDELKCPRNELVGLLTIGAVIPDPITPPLDRFSDWVRLLRATARTHQAAALFKNCLATAHPRLRRLSTPATLPPLDADLMKAAERHVLRRIQLESFQNEIHLIVNSKPIPSSSRISKLSPSLGEDKLLHLAGRIKAVENVDPNVRSPILLDGRHPAARLLVEHYHRRAGHANHEAVINEIRQRFWLLRLRNTVRTVANRCLQCRIRKAAPLNPPTGDLPPQRLAHHQRPFTFTGLDYFGPVNVTVGRRHEKRYVALYTCLTTRALHLELVHSLSADSAIMSLRRFIARRGQPDTIFSDNGTAFVGANRILREFFNENVRDFVATKAIRWKFIPPAAPTFGGAWERMVKTVKVALGATLKERSPKEETLATLLAEAEAIANSRPLTHVSVEPDDPTTITPFHFLLGGLPAQVSTPETADCNLFGRAEWRKALRLADLYWKRWVREVLPTLQPRQSTRSHATVRVGDTVIICDGTLPRGLWPLGRISQLHPGRDGVCRVVDVDTAAGTLRRPLRKIVEIGAMLHEGEDVANSS
ncbi:uncharacterized protein LOC126367197 [Pectinophora gossypiella]|uniref:uncharacterized protein LOC126367197 n=1 Tax=Pectinophora gossypiella TaxID=13191 RepID=UPI00214F1BAE|nr:uncharacterized protein LOC126367197 [Pectinophora gossypiella]